MHVTFIMPSVGRKKGEGYLRTWSMEPLGIATVSAVTPPDVKRSFFDDRMEPIDYEHPTDLVALSVETYTARRAYQIAAHYRDKGIPVVMGGFHPTLAPEDALEHADAIVQGQAEDKWPELLHDFSAGKMQRRYVEENNPSLIERIPDRSIYGNKKYQRIALVETARGCRFNCEFCSITKFYKQSYTQRPIEDIVKEISDLQPRYMFITDDNLGVDRERFRELLKALIPLKISWAGQVTMDIAWDDELLRLMRLSGCVCVLVGFESLNTTALSKMNKSVNPQLGEYEAAADAFRSHGIGVYGTFMFGYDGDDGTSLERAFAFAKRKGFFFAAFNHLVPFPGTPLYDRLNEQGRLLYQKWWLSDEYRFGDIAFRVEQMTEQELADLCYTFRRRFYGASSIFRRILNWRANSCSPRRLFLFLMLNVLSRIDVTGRQNLPLGIPEDEE